MGLAFMKLKASSNKSYIIFIPLTVENCFKFHFTFIQCYVILLIFNLIFQLCLYWNRNDLWALGCTLYQMLSGTSPFKDASEWLIFQRIIARDLSFPDYFSDEARDLIDKLLVSSRLCENHLFYFLFFTSLGSFG